MAALTADRVSVRYPGQAQPALDGVSLNVGRASWWWRWGRPAAARPRCSTCSPASSFPIPAACALAARRWRAGADRAVVFQQHALLPWLSALDNVAFGLRLRGVPRAEWRELAGRALAQVDLAEAGARYPGSCPAAEAARRHRPRLGRPRRRAADGRALRRAGCLHPRADAGTAAQGVGGVRQQRVPDHPRHRGGAVPRHRTGADVAGPGRIIKTLRPPFSRRWRAGDSARAIKSDPEFIALREQLLADVFASANRRHRHERHRNHRGAGAVVRFFPYRWRPAAGTRAVPAMAGRGQPGGPAGRLVAIGA
ncbi:Bicarbonate transport ATP-binding protein CmpD [Chromobacterium violaceum]|uniref:Bicarbonate transport ATP-binding protein CmpD n=1 Tax=Chromobacterium violaceum TaxID=536 RepID=A0A3S4HNN0_CHRVL|nr:Bicarbonate transport ATP-binding protein CmpD [Chromobacterium violaceum]